MENDFQAHITKIFVLSVGWILEILNDFVSTVGLRWPTNLVSFQP